MDENLSETELLACLVTDESGTRLIEAASKIKPEYFKKNQHAVFFKLLTDIQQQDKPITFSVIYSEILNRKLNLDIEYFSNLIQNSFIPAADQVMDYHMDQIIYAYTKRQVRRAGLKLEDLAQSDLPKDKLVLEAQKILSEATENEMSKSTYTMAEVYEYFGEDIENRGQGELGVQVGYTGIDRSITGGIRNGDYLVIGARPSMGKTTFLVNVLYNLAKKGVPSHFFSIETQVKRIYEKLIAIDSGLDHKKIVEGNLTREEAQIRDRSMRYIMSLPITITEAVSDIGRIWAISRKMKTKHKARLIALDHLQAMSNPFKHASSEYEQVTENSRQMKQLTISLDIPVIALSQLSRKVEDRNVKMPTMSDLRGSGGIEQQADHIWFLHRDEYYDPKPENKNVCTVKIAKQREGERGGNCTLFFNPEKQKFADLAGWY